MTDTIQIPRPGVRLNAPKTAGVLRANLARAVMRVVFVDVSTVAHIAPVVEHRALARSGRRAFLRLEGTTPGQ